MRGLKSYKKIKLGPHLLLVIDKGSITNVYVDPRLRLGFLWRDGFSPTFVENEIYDCITSLRVLYSKYSGNKKKYLNGAFAEEGTPAILAPNSVGKYCVLLPV